MNMPGIGRINEPQRERYLLALVLRLAFFAATWLLLSEGVLSSWPLAVPALLLATLLSLALAPPSGKYRISLASLPGLIWVFGVLTLRGSIDVARRALARRPRVNPGELEYRTRLQAGLPRIVFIYLLGLLPGTLCMEIEDGRLIIHVIDRDAGAGEELRRLEHAIGAFFGHGRERA